MKKTVIFLILFSLISFAMASNLNNYVVADADGYLLMQNNSENFSNLQNVPFMNFLFNRMGLGMMLQMTLSGNGLNLNVLNSLFGKGVEVVYQENQGFMCAFADSSMTPKDFIEKFTPQSSAIVKKDSYSYIKNGKDYAVFFNSNVFAYMSGISPEDYMKLLDSKGIYKGTLPHSNWVSMNLKLNPSETKDMPFKLPDQKASFESMNLKVTVDVQNDKLLLSMTANTKIDPDIKKLIENSSNDKAWFNQAKYFGSGMYIIASIDNINSIFDYAEQNAKKNDKSIIDEFKKYTNYFTGRIYMFLPLTVGDLLSSDDNSDNYILSMQYSDSRIIDQLDNNTGMSKGVKNGISYYETTGDGTKTYIYVDSDNIDISSLNPDDFTKMLSSARSPLSVKSYNILRKYIQNGLLSFYWDIGEDLEKSMYLKAPFNESGAVINLGYENGEIKLTAVIH